MIVFETIVVAFSMFSAIPMPKIEWNRRNMRFSLCAFWLIGAVIGLLCYAVSSLCLIAGIPKILRAALLLLIPVLVTGGIHLDGFADTADALASHAEPSKKLEIMKDPRTGSFAVIRLICTFILAFALLASLPVYLPVPVLLGFCLSRMLSGLAVAFFPMAKNTGLAHTFANAADKRTVSLILLICALAASAGLCFFGLCGIAMAAAAWLVFVYYYFMSQKQFGGITGDLAGWFLVRAEEWMLIALVAAEYLTMV